MFIKIYLLWGILHLSVFASRCLCRSFTHTKKIAFTFAVCPGRGRQRHVRHWHGRRLHVDRSCGWQRGELMCFCTHTHTHTQTFSHFLSPFKLTIAFTFMADLARRAPAAAQPRLPLLQQQRPPADLPLGESQTWRSNHRPRFVLGIFDMFFLFSLFDMFFLFFIVLFPFLAFPVLIPFCFV